MQFHQGWISSQICQPTHRQHLPRCQQKSNTAETLNTSVTHRHRLLLVCQPCLDDVLPLLPQSGCILDAKSVLEDFSDLLEGEAGDFRIEQEDQNPAETADGGVEAECSRWRKAFHHGQKRRRDNDVGTPARAWIHLLAGDRNGTCRPKGDMTYMSRTWCPWRELPSERNRCSSRRCCRRTLHKRRRTK
jgi:hypothetical protein